MRVGSLSGKTAPCLNANLTPNGGCHLMTTPRRREVIIPAVQARGGSGRLHCLDHVEVLYKELFLMSIAQVPRLASREVRVHWKKPTMYFTAVKTMMAANIHLMAFAGTYFWHRAPKYMPDIPPTPKRTPSSQSGATDMVG